MFGDISKRAYTEIRDMYIDGFTLLEASRKIGIDYTILLRAKTDLHRLYGAAHMVNRKRRNNRITLFEANAATTASSQ